MESSTIWVISSTQITRTEWWGPSWRRQAGEQPPTQEWEYRIKMDHQSKYLHWSNSMWVNQNTSIDLNQCASNKIPPWCSDGRSRPQGAPGSQIQSQCRWIHLIHTLIQFIQRPIEMLGTCSEWENELRGDCHGSAENKRYNTASQSSHCCEQLQHDCLQMNRVKLPSLKQLCSLVKLFSITQSYPLRGDSRLNEDCIVSNLMWHLVQ